MRRRNDFAAGLALAAVLALVCSCSTTVEILNQPGTTTTTDDLPPAEDDPPQPLDINGTWDTYATVLSDSCGFEAPEPYAPMLVSETVDGVTVTVSDGAGVCEESVRTRDGDTIRLNQTEVLDLGGAFVRVDLRIAYDFTADSFSGTVTQSFTDLSNAFPDDLPCEVTLEVTGTRCNGCWTGCTSTQHYAGGLAGLEIEGRLQELARR